MNENIQRFLSLALAISLCVLALSSFAGIYDATNSATRKLQAEKNASAELSRLQDDFGLKEKKINISGKTESKMLVAEKLLAVARAKGAGQTVFIGTKVIELSMEQDKNPIKDKDSKVILDPAALYKILEQDEDFFLNYDYDKSGNVLALYFSGE